jgi:GT2 family glycosyltransferase
MSDKKFPFVSVVVCTFNRGDNINPSIESLLKQTYPKDRYEIIVVDDGSTDVTKKINPREGVKIIRHEINRGIPTARNTGLAAAKGEIVAYIDDDAIADPDWLKCLMEPFDDPKVTGSGGRTFAYKTDHLAERYQAAGESGNPAPLTFGKSKNPFWRFWAYIKSMFVPVGIATQPTEVQAIFGLNCAYRVSALRSAGGFDEKLFAEEDSELCVRLRNAGAHIMFEPSAIIHHRHRESVVQLIRQTYRRSQYTVYYYSKVKKFLPIFPLPLIYLVGAIYLLIVQPIVGILFIFISPLILYSWWSIRAVYKHDLEYMVYGYIQLALESAAILGMARGKLFGTEHRVV